MLPYIITFSFSLLLLWFSGKIRSRYSFIPQILAVLIPAILAGLRDVSIGTDTGLYPVYTYDFVSHANSLSQAITWNDSVEGAYSFICYYATHIFNSFNFFLFVVSLITLIGIFWGSVASKENKVWLFFLFFFMYYNTSLNTQRQAMALCMCMPCMAYMIRKNYVMTALTFFLAFSFHHSALLFLSILLLYYFVFKNPKIFNRKVTKLVVVIGIVIILASFNSVLQSLVGFGLEDKYVGRYGSSDEYGSNVPISLFALNLFNLIIFKIIAAKDKGSRYYTFGEYMMIISFLLCFSGLISTFAVRVGTYFLFVNILILSHYLSGSKRIWQVSTAGFYVFYWVMTVAIANLGDTYPYQSQILETIF